jgi:hypothetical protein
MEAEMNLVLVGDAASNRLLARWGSLLPATPDSLAFVLDGRGYPTGKFGIVFAAANPQYPARSLVVFTAMAGRLGVFARPPLELGAAYALVGERVGLIETGNFTAGP